MVRYVLGQRARVQHSGLHGRYAVLVFRDEVGSALQVRSGFGLFRFRAGRPFYFRGLGPFIRGYQEVGNRLISRKPIQVLWYVFRLCVRRVLLLSTPRQSSKYNGGSFASQVFFISLRELRGNAVFAICQGGKRSVLHYGQGGRVSYHGWHFFIYRNGHFLYLCNYGNQPSSRRPSGHHRRGFQLFVDYGHGWSVRSNFREGTRVHHTGPGKDYYLFTPRDGGL